MISLVRRSARKNVENMIFCCGYGIGDIKEGSSFTEKVRFTKEENSVFCKFFSLHESDTISPVLINNLFTRVIGSNIHQSIYLSQTINNRGFVQFGDEIECKVEIVENLGKNKYRLVTTASVEGKIIVDGEAILMRESDKLEKNV